MRTQLFLSTLFAVSLVGGVALAEKPHDQARAPRAIENLRAHGDTVDKSYTSADRSASSGAASQSVATTQSSYAHTKGPVDKGASRINCSESGADCSASHGGGGTQAAGMEAGASVHGYAVQAPAFMDKILGSDRTNFNEAGEDEGMSSRAVKRAWSHGSVHASHERTGAVVPLAEQRQVVRVEGEASSDRMSCNDADECMMSSKAAKKDWAYNAIKAGTWQGPPAAQPSNAARAIAEQKASEGKATKQAELSAGHSAAHAAQHESDHQH